MQIDEKTFDQAVTIAAAFVINGDIRCGGSTREDSTAQAQVGDMITTAYKTLLESRKHLRNQPD